MAAYSGVIAIRQFYLISIWIENDLERSMDAETISDVISTRVQIVGKPTKIRPALKVN